MTESTLLLATTNDGKAREIRLFLEGLPWRIITLNDLSACPSFKEKGTEFLENARGKSLYYGRLTQGLSLGEDSGLEIDALGGAPGIKSARFSGPRATDAANNEKVLYLLRNTPEPERSARFISTMVLSIGGKVIHEISESVEGKILFRPKGKGGFGYDPIFFYPPLAKTFAELRLDEKNEVSHRGKALQRLKDFLARLAGKDPDSY